MTSNDSEHMPLRDVAQSPEATARYLADVQLTLLTIEKNLQTLEHETRVHCRGTYVDGDRWYHGRLRSLPVEMSLRDVLKHAKSLVEGLEKSAYKRNAFAETVKNLPRERREKELNKKREKRAPSIQSAPDPEEDAQKKNRRYSEPASIFDLRDRESA